MAPELIESRGKTAPASSTLTEQQEPLVEVEEKESRCDPADLEHKQQLTATNRGHRHATGHGEGVRTNARRRSLETATQATKREGKEDTPRSGEPVIGTQAVPNTTSAVTTPDAATALLLQQAYRQAFAHAQQQLQMQQRRGSLEGVVVTFGDEEDGVDDDITFCLSTATGPITSMEPDPVASAKVTPPPPPMSRQEPEHVHNQGREHILQQPQHHHHQDMDYAPRYSNPPMTTPTRVNEVPRRLSASNTTSLTKRPGVYAVRHDQVPPEALQGTPPPKSYQRSTPITTTNTSHNYVPSNSDNPELQEQALIEMAVRQSLQDLPSSAATRTQPERFQQQQHHQPPLSPSSPSRRPPRHIPLQSKSFNNRDSYRHHEIHGQDYDGHVNSPTQPISPTRRTQSFHESSFPPSSPPKSPFVWKKGPGGRYQKCFIDDTDDLHHDGAAAATTRETPTNTTAPDAIKVQDDEALARQLMEQEMLEQAMEQSQLEQLQSHAVGDRAERNSASGRTAPFASSSPPPPSIQHLEEQEQVLLNLAMAQSRTTSSSSPISPMSQQEPLRRRAHSSDGIGRDPRGLRSFHDQKQLNRRASRRPPRDMPLHSTLMQDAPQQDRGVPSSHVGHERVPQAFGEPNDSNLEYRMHSENKNSNMSRSRPRMGRSQSLNSGDYLLQQLQSYATTDAADNIANQALTPARATSTSTASRYSKNPPLPPFTKTPSRRTISRAESAAPRTMGTERPAVNKSSSTNNKATGFVWKRGPNNKFVKVPLYSTGPGDDQPSTTSSSFQPNPNRDATMTTLQATSSPQFRPASLRRTCSTSSIRRGHHEMSPMETEQERLARVEQEMMEEALKLSLEEYKNQQIRQS